MYSRLTLILTFILLLQSTHIVAQDNTVPELPDILPSFPGGQNAMIKFISIEFRPVIDSLSRIEAESGTVYTKYTIDTTGALKNIEIMRSYSPEVDAKVLELFRKMPAWSPAIKDGKPVDFTMQLPIKFSFEESKSRRKRRK